MALYATPVRLRSGLTLRHRIAKAATSEGLARGGDPSPELLRLYETWSLGGASLIITGNTSISRRYRERMGNVVLDERTDRVALTRLAAAATAGGSAALVQLCHPGRQTSRFVAGDPVAPSAGPAVAMLGAFARPRALEEEEVERIIDDFVRGARLAREAGFDGVQIHGAHGFLINQFLSPRLNLRGDRWGGPLENRARLALEVVRRTRVACGNGFTIAVKLNVSDFVRGGFAPAESLAVAQMLDRAGIDLLELSGGDVERAALLGLQVGETSKEPNREGYFLEHARIVKRHVGAAVMLTGGLRTVGAIEGAIAEGAYDVAGMARPLCLDPTLPRRMVRGEVPGATLPERRRGPAAIAALSETAYYAWRLGAIARGKPITAEPSPLAAALGYVWSDAAPGLRRTLFGERAEPAREGRPFRRGR
jgi:2,4-dienoyl-CoA reductase-like NADH-dependent reductase (Old Yellow Enzyme family)